MKFDDLFGDPSVGPFFDIDLQVTPPLGTPAPPRPRCFRCEVELCPDLDQYYGRTPGMETVCSKCRKYYPETP
jgi:hypothetical protein